MTADEWTGWKDAMRQMRDEWLNTPGQDGSQING